MPLKLSVIIPTYNRSLLLSYTLDSLLLQDVSVDDFEVVVSDDGSSDNTKHVVDQYAQRMNLKYIYQQDQGYCVGSARNKAILKAQGDVCLFLDSGILAKENCIRKHIQFHETAEKNCSAIGYIYGFGGDEGSKLELKNIISPSNVGDSIRKLSDSGKYEDKRNTHYLKYDDCIQDLPAPWLYFWTCHASARRSDIINIGMFDTRFDGRWGVEDNDLGFRLHRAGIDLVLLREAQAIHYPHSDNAVEKISQGYLNCIEFDKKYQTESTRLFLCNYRSNKFTDINALINNPVSNVS